MKTKLIIGFCLCLVLVAFRTKAAAIGYGVNESISLMTNLPTATNNYLISLQALTDEAKALISFKDKNGTPKAWLAFHDYLSFPDNRHQHISIETADLSGQLQSRLEVPYDCDHCNVGTVSGSNFSVSEGELRVGFDNSANKNVVFQLHANDATTTRWNVRTDNAKENGSNSGSDFKLVRYSDSGIALDSPIFVKRSTGFVGINSKAPASALTVGTVSDSKKSYTQIDAESGIPASADCDSDSERGRMISDYANNRVYVCNGSLRGWDYLSLND